MKLHLLVIRRNCKGWLVRLRRFISKGGWSPSARLKDHQDWIWLDRRASKGLWWDQEVFDLYWCIRPTIDIIHISGPLFNCSLPCTRELGRIWAYYLSQILTEQGIPRSKSLCLTVYFACACTKLRCYLLPVWVYLICATDVVKYMLSRPIFKGKRGNAR